MKNILLCVALVLALAAGAAAQPITTLNGKRSDEIYTKLRKIDLLNQILPLLLTKDQINKILPAVERARAKQKAVLTAEDEALAKLQSEIDETYSKAIEKDTYPTKDFLKLISSKTAEMTVKREIARSEMVEDLTKALTATLNEGQKKAMVNSFSPKFIDPSKKPEDITEAAKIEFFVGRVLLDPLAREILMDLAAHKE
jgi:tRNA nucleotidyltransferase/poly(A) polymerase